MEKNDEIWNDMEGISVQRRFQYSPSLPKQHLRDLKSIWKKLF